MKAILMLANMPNSCIECMFSFVYANDQLEETNCRLLGQTNEKGTSTRCENCPLLEINDNIAKLIEVAR